MEHGALHVCILCANFSVHFPRYCMKMARFGVSTSLGVGSEALADEVVVLLELSSGRSSDGLLMGAMMSFRVWWIMGS